MELHFTRISPVWFCEQTAWPGVHRVCSMVRKDIFDVTGTLPDMTDIQPQAKEAVLVGTLGRSAMMDHLAAEGKLDLAILQGKREAYAFLLVEAPLPGIDCALVVAGSDKRGTIYGLFHLSELLGVSPLKDWAEILPAKRTEVTLDERCNIISKEPSVRYRGIFLNDEWPALGTWATTRFGGFNAEMYAHVFTLILRLKGNYLWPAMWKSCFSLEGPGLASAELADELGIVMGNSHHEPCMRAGEEYAKMRGPDSPYGDAWDFRTNREGITRFWRDGLERNAPFENIITLGMRGEQDTPIMGKGATLGDNIQLLREVLRRQNCLIQETIDPDLQKVQRLFVLFTEVEAFFYGNGDTRGLMGDPVLDGVTLMLSDDNFGNLRSLPTEEMLGHPGGFGLYYHLDFHGGAYAYDWMNTNYLPKMWEQLTTAWENGIREVWIANIGDLCMLEYPLSYFMDLAYDMESHGAGTMNQTRAWTDSWVTRQFGHVFGEADCGVIRRLLEDYTLINHNRKPEVMNVGVYHPTHFGETQRLLDMATAIAQDADRLLQICPEAMLPAFWELVYYPAAASANHCKLWLYATLNEAYARQGRMEANDYANLVRQCILLDRALTGRYHAIGHGRFYGMALSEHIGFVWWNEDGNRYPILMRVEGANKPRLLVADSRGEQYTIGSRWSGDAITISHGLRQDVSDIAIDLACGSREPVVYTAQTDCPWLRLSHHSGTVSKKDVLTATIDREKLHGRDTGMIMIRSAKTSYIYIEAENRDASVLPAMTYVEADGYICMDAKGFARKQDTPDAAWMLLTPYGRTGSAVKVLPPTVDFYGPMNNRPWIEYCFDASAEGAYQAQLYMAPSNTATMEHRLCFGMQMNGEDIEEVNGVGQDFHSLDLNCMEWDGCVRNNIRVKTLCVQCRRGVNRLRLYAGSPLVVLERIVLYPYGSVLPQSYLGPCESWQIV